MAKDNEPKPIEYTLSNFFGGVSDDIRQDTANGFSISKHFDIFSFPKRLVPYRSLEADADDGSTATGMKQYLVKDYVYSSTDAKLYGLGQTGATLTKIVYKGDATVGTWTLPASSEGNAAVKNGCFIEYKDYLWGFQGNNQIWKWGLLSGTPAITNSVATVASTITSVANGVIGADGNLYIAYNNVVVRINTSGTVTDSAKTVPSNFKIISMCNYGKFLAIGCAPISTFNGVSKVFLWDLSSDLFAETIEWGEGELRVLENIEGYIVGVTDRYLNNAVGAGRGSMIIQTYQGGTPQVVKEVQTLALTNKTMPINKAVKNNRLFFAAKIMTDIAGTTYNEGIWSFGRKNASYPWALTLDIIDENIDSDGIQAFGSAANYFFITHSGDGSIDKTNDAATYAFTSILESQVFNWGDSTKSKNLLGCKLTAASSPTGGTATLKYRKDFETSWTTIGSFTVASLSDKNFDVYLNIESSSDNLPSFREIQFRIESTGGAEITSWSARALPVSEVM